jgi:hypothetical protein
VKPPFVVAAAWFPGSMRAIGPVVKALFARGWDGRIATTEAALPVVERHGFERRQVLIFGRMPIDPEVLIASFTPDLFVAGIAECTPAERQWLSSARRYDIPSLGLLDTWGEYANRIGLASVAAGEFTDVLGVMNERAKEHLARECSWPRIVATGNPGLEEFLTASNDDGARSRAKATLGIAPSSEVVSFFSQPIDQKLGTTIGYTQYDALRTLARHVNPAATLLAAAHPLDDVEALRSSLDGRGQVLAHYDPKVVYAASDLVASCYSACLLEAALSLRPTVSLQPGLNGRSRCWSATLGVSEIAVTEEEAPAAIARAMAVGLSPTELLRRRDLIGLQPGAVDRLVTIATRLAAKSRVITETSDV